MKNVKKILLTVLIILTFMCYFVPISRGITGNETVFITINSSKYHLAGCDYLDGRPYGRTLAWAKANGYGACKYCRPYLPVEYKETTSITELILLMTGITLFIFVVVYTIQKIDQNKEKIKKKLFNSNTSYDIEDYNIKSINEKINFINDSIDKIDNSKVKIETNLNVAENAEINMKEDSLPMAWYSFWVYFRIPFGLIIDIGDILNLLLTNSISILALMLSIIIISFEIILMRAMLKRKRNTFKYICIALVLEVFTMASNVFNFEADKIIFFFIYIVIFLGIWFLPNYIYFKKRKGIFKN